MLLLTMNYPTLWSGIAYFSDLRLSLHSNRAQQYFQRSQFILVFVMNTGFLPVLATLIFSCGCDLGLPQVTQNSIVPVKQTVARRSMLIDFSQKCPEEMSGFMLIKVERHASNKLCIYG